nr:hypothetical protein [Bacteroides acidifaciens]
MTHKYFTHFSKRLQEGNMEEIAKQYQENFVAISNYIKSLLSKSISDFNIQNPPDDWNTYFDLLAEAQTKTKTWTQTIWSDLGSIPQEIKINSDTIKARFERISQICADLQNFPTDDISVRDLKNNMDMLIGAIKNILDRIGLLLDNIVKFDGEIIEIANELKQIADMALADKEVDERKIKQLEADIKAAKNEVSMLAAEIAAASVGIVASVAISVLTFFISPIGGAIVTVFLGIPIAVGATVIALDSMKIQGLNQEIKMNSESLSRYEADILQLEMMADEFSEMSEQAKLLKDNLRFIYDIWADLYNDLKEVDDEVLQAYDMGIDSNIPHTSGEWRALQEAMEQAKNDFILFVEKSQYFDVSGIEGIDAQIELGMSEKDIEKQLAVARKTDLITYLTA